MPPLRDVADETEIHLLVLIFDHSRGDLDGYFPAVLVGMDGLKFDASLMSTVYRQDSSNPKLFGNNLILEYG